MNIHEAVLQPIAASCTVIATQQPAVAGREVANFRAPAGACATNSAQGQGFAKIIL